MLFAIMLVALTPMTSSPEDASLVAEKPEILKFDIMVKQSGKPCEQSTADEIIVCAERVDNESHRLRPVRDTKKFEKDESKAEFTIGENAVMTAEAENAELGGGVQSKRAMVRLKIAF